MHVEGRDGQTQEIETHVEMFQYKYADMYVGL